MMEARYRQILSIAPDAIVAMDEALHIAMFNQAAERLFGYSADEAIGQSAEILLPARFVAPVGNRSGNSARRPTPPCRSGTRRTLRAAQERHGFPG